MADKKELSLQERLIAIQGKLKAPKGQYNSFGKYNYRSCEDILEAVKPLLKEQGIAMVITDEMVGIGTRIYVKSTATLMLGDEKITGVGYAREDESKKGMDGSQVTGASSSYARKYALNGLFLIDDTKDSDALNDGGQQPAKAAPKQAKAAAAPTHAPQAYPELDIEKELIAEGEANMSKSSGELTAVWNKYTAKTSPFYHPAYGKEGSVFRKAVAERGRQLKEEGK